MSTLYRDYRPQNFTEVLGQNHIKITLQNEISANKLAQAFLFCGPRAVGKTTLARVLAKTVNCLDRKDGEFEPCNKCSSCISTTLGKNLDVVEIDAASNTGVDNVRENIIGFSRLTPVNSKFKVFIIDEVHMLSISAFNALLKIIEEPPVHVIFILCTTEIQKVPLTIISRCERFDFKRISVSDVVKKLSLIARAEKIDIDAAVLDAVARRSGGHLRDAESLLGQIFSLGGNKISLEQAELVIPHYNSNEAVDLLDYLSRKDAGKAISLVNGLVDSGVNLKNFTGELVGLLRKIMLTKVSPGLADNLGLSLGESLEIKINAISDNLSWELLISFTRRFLEAYNDNKNPLISQLPLELAIIDLCYSSQRDLYSSASSQNIIPSSTSSPKTSIANSSAQILKKEIDLKSNNDLKTEISPAKKDEGGEVLRTVGGSANTVIINLSESEVLEKWPEFLVRIKKHNHSLSFVLQNCQPQGIKDNRLCLVFKYKFHQDRINDVTIKNIVETTLAEVYGSMLSVSSLINENLEIRREEKSDEAPIISAGEPVSEKKAEGVIGDLLKAFGGEVIN
ncbi:MAG: DNA polymerase III subunit gamma/tau [Candidatus Falkowbacteria bacterium]